jgi:hypothetical protein
MVYQTVYHGYESILLVYCCNYVVTLGLVVPGYSPQPLYIVHIPQTPEVPYRLNITQIHVHVRFQIIMLLLLACSLLASPEHVDLI